jgi:hypothetical protein
MRTITLLPATLLLLLLILASACSPPCPTYWEAVCKACGPSSPGCEHAKDAAKREAGTSEKCTSFTTAFSELGELGKQRYCETWKNDPRKLDELRGPWICSGVKVDFKGPSEESKSSSNPQQIVVNDTPFVIYNLKTSSFQREQKASCQYYLMPTENSGGEKALSIRCPDSLGALPGDTLVECLHAK